MCQKALSEWRGEFTKLVSPYGEEFRLAGSSTSFRSSFRAVAYSTDVRVLGKPPPIDCWPK